MVNIRLGTPSNAWTVSRESVNLVRPQLPPVLVTADAKPQRVTLDLARTAVIVVDMQNDFCHSDGWLASIGVDISPARGPIGPLQHALPALRRAGTPVVWLNWGNRADRANLPPGVLHVYNPDGAGNGIGAAVRAGGSPTLQAGSWSAAIVDELKPEPGDIHVDKYRMSGFFDTALESILRNLAVTTLLFAGVNIPSACSPRSPTPPASATTSCCSRTARQRLPRGSATTPRSTTSRSASASSPRPPP